MREKRVHHRRIHWKVTRIATPATCRLLVFGAIVSILTGCDGFFIDPALTAVTVTPSSPSVTIGGTQQMTATGTYDDGSKRSITDGVGRPPTHRECDGFGKGHNDRKRDHQRFYKCIERLNDRDRYCVEFDLDFNYPNQRFTLFGAVPAVYCDRASSKWKHGRYDEFGYLDIIEHHRGDDRQLWPGRCANGEQIDQYEHHRPVRKCDK